MDSSLVAGKPVVHWLLNLHADGVEIRSRAETLAEGLSHMRKLAAIVLGGHVPDSAFDVSVEADPPHLGALPTDLACVRADLREMADKLERLVSMAAQLGIAEGELAVLLDVSPSTLESLRLQSGVTRVGPEEVEPLSSMDSERGSMFLRASRVPVPVELLSGRHIEP